MSINFVRWKIESPKFVIRCIMDRSWKRLYLVEFDLDFLGHLG